MQFQSPQLETPEVIEVEQIVLAPEEPFVQLRIKLFKRESPESEALAYMGTETVQLNRDDATDLLAEAAVGTTLEEVIINAISARYGALKAGTESRQKQEKKQLEEKFNTIKAQADKSFYENVELRARLAQFESLDWKNAPRDLQLFAHAMGAPGRV